IYVLVVDRRRRRDTEAFKETIAALTSRLYSIEQQSKSLEALTARLFALEQQAKASTPWASPARPPEQTAPAAAHTEPKPVPPPVPAKPPVSPASPTPAQPVTTSASHASQPAMPGMTRPLQPPPRPPVQTGVLSGAASHAEVPVKKKKSISLEEMVGTNWLPKLGITAVVVGVALLVASQWGRIGL